MSVCAVMVVRDEIDIIARVVGHLLEHVDEVLVADNMSVDGTYELLRAMEEAQPDVLRVRRDEEPGHYQGRKVTALAGEALQRGHRWVVPCDADEVWYAPEGRTLRDWLDAVGRETQFVKAAIYNHVCTVEDDLADTDPVTRIRWRQRVPLDIRWGKVACRLRPDLVIADGNHSASTQGTGTTAHGLMIRHFPYRSADQFVSKAVNGALALSLTDLPEGTGAHWRAYGDHIAKGGPEAGRSWFYEWFQSSDPEADDSLVYDPAPVRETAA